MTYILIYMYLSTFFSQVIKMVEGKEQGLPKGHWWGWGGVLKKDQSKSIFNLKLLSLA